MLSLVAVEWPFADFLMTKSAANRFFGTGYFQYSMPSTSADFLRQFENPEHGAMLWGRLALAMFFAFLSTWLGIVLGRWMRDLQR